MKGFKFVFVIILIYLFLQITLAQTEQHDEHEEHEEHAEDGHIDEYDDHDHDDHEETADSHVGDTKDIWIAIGITTFAGFAAFIGAFSIFCIKPQQIGVLPASLSFSSGIIIYLGFVNLIPESEEQFYHSIGKESEAMSSFYTLICVMSGIVISLLMELIFSYFGIDPHDHSHKNDDHQNGDILHSSFHEAGSNQMVIVKSSTYVSRVSGNEDDDIDDDEDEDGNDNSCDHHEPIKPAIRSDLSRLSYSVAIALILHHFPEGIATFISLYHDLEFGILVALALALHDIPSGICIAVPVYCATQSKCKPFVLCFIAAITYPIGAFVGWCVVETTSDQFVDGFIGVLFGITGGIMLFVAFVELLPNAIITANRFSSSTTKAHSGIYHQNILTISIILLFIGFLIMSISSILLQATGGHSH